MSAQEIIRALGSLTAIERREVARKILEMQAEAETLENCDRRADANFQILDHMEAHNRAANLGQVRIRR